MNQRTHPELHWQTLATEHFNIHYHQGLESIAQHGAGYAEQCYQPIMDQLQLQDFGKTDVVLSAEDEIMNGFAMPSDQIFIWVSQNDVAGHFGGSEKWLKQVIAHEFQHVAQFRAQRTWAGVLGGISIPSWWLEGMAEYLTEVWRVGRSDAQLKIHTYRNSLEKLDPHDDGYAKLLYLAWKYGDSTLVKISQHRLYLDSQQRYPYWYDFKTAFESSTGQTLASFNEEWRRVMNTYYYGYKAQKEAVEEVGEAIQLKGISSLRAARISADFSRIAVLGRRDRAMRDYGLYVLTTDSSQHLEEVHYGQFTGMPDWSPDASQIVVSEYHRGRHGSLIYDLRLVDVQTKKLRWLTRDLRAHHPRFSGDGRGIFFVAHPGETTQIYYQQISTGRQVQLSNFSGDVQIRDLDLDAKGQRLAFAIQDSSGDVDIAILDIDGSNFRKLTQDPEEDLFPVWTSAGDAVVFTSYRNSTPNLYRLDLDSLNMVQMTDVAEGISSSQRIPNSNRIAAATLGDVDTVRIRSVSSDRVAPDFSLNIREPYTAWRTKAPDIRLPQTEPDQSLVPGQAHVYRPGRSLRPLARIVWPDVEGLFGMVVFTDALGKHLIQAATVLGYDASLQGGYASYLNLSFKPAMHFFVSRDLAFNLRHTFDQSFVEMRNGGGVSLELPMNGGSSLSRNHSLRLSALGLQRDLYTSFPTAGALADPATRSSTSAEFNLGITYEWKSQRPRQDQYFLPRDGTGFLAHLESALPQIYGENDYSQIWLEGFHNRAIPKTPVVFYTRLKWISQTGSIVSQDSIGFSETAPLYFSNAYWNTLKGTGLFDTPESYSLRGQSGHYPARELVYAVLELRVPILTRIPVNILGLGIQNITAAAFYDFGYLPDSRIDLSTYGAELKFDLSFLRFSLLTMALGVGGDSPAWENSTELEPYLRLALVNPF